MLKLLALGADPNVFVYKHHPHHHRLKEPSTINAAHMAVRRMEHSASLFAILTSSRLDLTPTHKGQTIFDVDEQWSRTQELEDDDADEVRMVKEMHAQKPDGKREHVLLSTFDILFTLKEKLLQAMTGGSDLGEMVEFLRHQAHKRAANGNVSRAIRFAYLMIQHPFKHRLQHDEQEVERSNGSASSIRLSSVASSSSASSSSASATSVDKGATVDAVYRADEALLRKATLSMRASSGGCRCDLLAHSCNFVPSPEALHTVSNSTSEQLIDDMFDLVQNHAAHSQQTRPLQRVLAAVGCWKKWLHAFRHVDWKRLT